MSLILRHKPSAGNLHLDNEGYANVSDVLRALRENVGPLNRTDFEALVENNDKQRFAFNERKDKIRASQGHSIPVVLDLEPLTPPAHLYHGTKQRFMGEIMKDGLSKMKRQHVHLSATLDTAEIVAARRNGDTVILIVDTDACPGPFFKSANGVWLTDAVPREALSIHYGDAA